MEQRRLTNNRPNNTSLKSYYFDMFVWIPREVI